MEAVLFSFGLALKVIRLVAVPVLRLIFGRQMKKLPPIRNDLLKISAVDLAERIRRKEVTSEEVVKLYIDRIRQVNPIINAVVDERFAGALEEARKADTIVSEAESTLYLLQNYPLLGVPFSVKESIGVKGETVIRKVHLM